jgi:hypothetical protein
MRFHNLKRLDEDDLLRHFTSANSKVREGEAGRPEAGRKNSDFILAVRPVWYG